MKAVLTILQDPAGKMNTENRCKTERIEGKWRVPECYSKVTRMIHPSEEDS